MYALGVMLLLSGSEEGFPWWEPGAGLGDFACEAARRRLERVRRSRWRYALYRADHRALGRAVNAWS